MTPLQKDTAILAVAVAVLGIVLSAAIQSLWGTDAGLLFLAGMIYSAVCREIGRGIRKRREQGEK